MPIPPLYDRGYDSILEFERSAGQRHAEARLLDKRSYKLAGIYLYGYSVEMRLKALFFRNSGFPTARLITPTDWNDARAMWQVLGLLAMPGQQDIAGWAQLAVAARATTVFPPYGRLGSDVVSQATTIYLIWREFLRYRSEAPTTREWRASRDVAEWFERNYHHLV